MQQTVTIAGRPVGPGQPPYIVAEISANHGGQLDHALAIVDAAAEARVDAVKIQTLDPGRITLDSDRPEFQITKGPRAGQSLYELYQKAVTPRAWHGPIFERAAAQGIAAFSSPFDLDAVEFLAGFDVPAFKIASFEIVDIPLIRCAARLGKPMIMSTGMAGSEDIADAVAACRAEGNDQIILLYCVSGYPTPVSEVNLANIPALKDETGCLVGLSDHTLTTSTSVAAVALGACFVEKHITLRRADGGLDAAFSLEPAEFTQLAAACREASDAIGTITTELKPSEVYTSRLRRSLYVVAPIATGETFSPENVASVRPNQGLAPKHYDEILGCTASVDIPAGTPLTWDLVAK